MSHDERLTEISLAHAAALDLQEQMRAAALRRDDLVREAIAAGVPVIPIATALGVDRQRVYQMAKH